MGHLGSAGEPVGLEGCTDPEVLGADWNIPRVPFPPHGVRESRDQVGTSSVPRSRWGWREACVLDMLVWGTSREPLYPLGRGVTCTQSGPASDRPCDLLPQGPHQAKWAGTTASTAPGLGPDGTKACLSVRHLRGVSGRARRRPTSPQPQLRSGPRRFPAHRAPRLLQGGRVPWFLSRGPTDTKPSHGAWRWGRWGQWQPRPRQAGPSRGCWAPSNQRPSAGGSALGLRGQDRARGGGAGARLPVGPPPDGFVRVPLGAPARAGGRGCGEAASPVQPPPQAPCMWPLPGRWRCSPSSRCSALFFRSLKGHCPGLVPGSRAGAGGGKRSVRWAQVPPPRAEPCATPGSRASVLVCPGQSWP